MTKRALTFLLALALALSLAPAALAAPLSDFSDADVPAFSVYGVTLDTERHINYIQGTGNGYFTPNANITRGEAAVMLYRLLADKVPVTVSYTDVPEGAWYHDAALELGSLGVIRPDETTFRWSDVITRGEFVRYIASFFPLRTDAEQFPDVDPEDENAPYILSARAYGWLEGDENGHMNAQNPLHRSDGVTMLNWALGRAGDKVVIDGERPALYLDVDPGMWYYQNVMEATVPHEYSAGEDGEVWSDWTEADTGLPDGFRTEGAHLIDGWSYYYDAAARDILRGESKNGFTAGADGRFTTGDSWIDSELRSIILAQTTPSMSQPEMLRACFGYCRDSYKYLSWSTYPRGDTSFVHDAARQMLSNGRGNCYCYASVFYYLSRWLGYDPSIFSGSVYNGDRFWGTHSWVEIADANGQVYVYDTQLEWREVHDYGDSSYYWFFYHMDPSKTTFRYVK